MADPRKVVEETALPKSEAEVAPPQSAGASVTGAAVAAVEGVARVGSGLGEGANFPAAIKTVAEWFPKKERALATGVFSAGSNLGSIIVPLTVPWIVAHYGWQGAFVATGALGFVWLVFWLPVYRRPEEHPRLSAEELAHIKSDPAEPTT